jgi:hypothetical protein
MGHRLEYVLTFERDGERVVTTSTPSMWGRADEYRDKLRVAKPGHTVGWYNTAFQDAVCLMAAKAEGLTELDVVDDPAATYGNVLAFYNDWDVTHMDVPEPDAGGEDPSRGGMDADR